MRMRRPIIYAITTALLLSACSESQPDQSDGGVTPGEAQALNDAAEMLDKSEAEGNIAKAK